MVRFRCSKVHVFVCSTALVTILYMIFAANVRFIGHHTIRGHKVKQKACIQAKLTLYPSQMFKDYFKDHDKIPICKLKENWVKVEHGIFKIQEGAKKKYGKKLKCDFLPLIRGEDDFDYHFGNWSRDIQDGTDVSATVASKVNCSAGNDTYDNHHLTIPVRKEIKERQEKAKQPKDASDMNVLMFGFDSVSRMTWLRKLPKSYAYMRDVMNFVTLEDYNIVGDGTLHAILPMLTGKEEIELPECRYGRENSTVLDDFPWIWFDYKKAGYATLYVEDGKTFTWRMKGFKKTPMDFQALHFYRTLFKKHKDFCLECEGADVGHNVMFNFISEFMKVYDGGRTFTFAMHGECSHNNVDPLNIVDEDFKKWLQSLMAGGYLNNTVLILFGDHGLRRATLRATVQGKQEERNAFFAVRVPSWFSKKHPRAYKNLHTNSKRLSTPFDVHATFKHLLNFKDVGIGNISDRGISLFKEIPAFRSCKHAAIPPAYCNCLSWKKVNTSSVAVKMAAKEFLKFVNRLTKPERPKCHTLKIGRIMKALKFTPSDQILKFKQAADYHSRIFDMTSKSKTEDILYMLTVVTKPGGGQFEFTVNNNLRNNTFILAEGDVSRINMYGDASGCVANRLPHLGPYCVCKKSGQKLLYWHLTGANAK